MYGYNNKLLFKIKKYKSRICLSDCTKLKKKTKNVILGFKLVFLGAKIYFSLIILNKAKTHYKHMFSYIHVNFVICPKQFAVLHIIIKVHILLNEILAETQKSPQLLMIVSFQQWIILTFCFVLVLLFVYDNYCQYQCSFL